MHEGCVGATISSLPDAMDTHLANEYGQQLADVRRHAVELDNHLAIPELKVIAKDIETAIELWERLEALEAQFILPVIEPRVPPVAAPGGPPKVLRRRDYSLVQDSQDRVGEAPTDRRPQVAIVQQNTGVLTPAGTVVFEPSITFSHTDVNRFVVGGVAILDTVLIGVFEVTQADRDTITSSFGRRFGVTERLEI